MKCSLVVLIVIMEDTVISKKKIITMYPALLTCLLVIASMQSSQAQPDPEVCTPGPGDAKGHKLPTLPEQYSAVIEAIIVNRNYTTITTEVYDDIGNRGAISSHFGSYGTTKTYYDYDDEQYYMVFENNTCITRNLTNHTFSAFGFHRTTDGRAHINSAKDIFHFGEHFNETYMGETTIDDDMTTVDWWRACLYESHRDHTYTLDFYFTIDHPERPSLPVRMVINGTGPNYRENGTHWFYHIYKFVHIHTEKQPDSAFLPPLGVACPGRVSHKPVPKIPEDFDIRVETASLHEKTIHYLRTSYNLEAKLVAFESVPDYPVMNEPYPIREIHDYNTGISYRINTKTGSCQIGPIPTNSTDSISLDGVNVAMRGPSSFFVLNTEDVDWVYEGKDSFRGIDGHAWITRRDGWKPGMFHGYKDVTVNSTWEYYFASEDWTTDNAPKSSEKISIPLGLTVKWKAQFPKSATISNGTDTYAFFHYTGQASSSHHFDIGHCYTNTNESLHLAFNLEGIDTYKKYIANNTFAFYYGTRRSIAKSIGVAPTRISSLRVAEGYHKMTTVFFTLLERPSMTGNSLNATDPGPSLSRAYKELQLLVNSEGGSMLVIEFIYRDDIEHINAFVDTLREETSPLIEQKAVGLGTGTVAGIAIGTFLLGAVIALVAAFFVYKKTAASDVPYSVQE